MYLLKYFITILLVNLLIFDSSAALCQELREPFISPRPSAVGGAFTAIANDESAIWTNPAGITRIRKARSRKDITFIKVPGLVAGANSKSKDFITGVSSGSASVDQIASKSDSLSDKPFWAFTGLFPITMFEVDDVPMVFGIYSGNSLTSILDQNDSTRADTQVTSDLGVILGAAYSHPSNRLSLGLIAKYLTRYAFEEKLALSVLSDPKLLQEAVKIGSNKSAAFSYDLGFIWTLADFWFPTFGVSILNAPTGCKADYLNPYSKVRENVCGTKFSGQFSNPEALSTLDPTDIRLGMSITPRFGRSFGVKIALDAHHLSTSLGNRTYGLSEVDITKKLHAGLEFFTGNPLVPPPFVIGVGIGQGFYSYGFTTRLSRFSIEFASFGRDISAGTSPKEDRRYIGGLSVVW